MTPLDGLALSGVGLLAGAVNTIAGAGSLLTYPVLVAVGLSPLSANVTNDLGVMPGNASGAIGLREELRGQLPRLKILVPLGALGSTLGAVLLLAFPARAFEVAAPILLLLASIATAFQPVLARKVAARGGSSRNAFWSVIVAISTYGGYFGTGIGVLFFAALGVYVDDTAPRLNATKQILALVSNGIAGIIFAFLAPINWLAVLILGVASGVGGPLGAKVSRYIPAAGLRAVVCLVGAGAAIYLGVKQL